MDFPLPLPSTSPRRGRTATLLAFVLLVGLAARPSAAQPFQTEVAHAILVDFQTGSVLFQKGADLQMAPASFAKLMTMAVVFAALRSGELGLEDRFTISDNAWRKGGAPSGTSTMFAVPGSSVRVEDLIRGVIVQSGNDAAIALAEGLAGSEEAFAERMNLEAASIGLRASHFANATGLPAADQLVTARDMAVLAVYIIAEFPEYYPIYGEREFTWNNITQRNRNPLLRLDIGADGMVTGFTEESGYGLVATTMVGGRRLVAVINGAADEAERATVARELLDWGYRSFEMAVLLPNGGIVAEAAVFGGAEATVGLRTAGPIEVLLPVAGVGQVEALVIYPAPVPAPIAEGQEIGHLVILVDGGELARWPLYSERAVAIGTLPQRAGDAVANLFDRLW